MTRHPLLDRLEHSAAEAIATIEARAAREEKEILETARAEAEQIRADAVRDALRIARRTQAGRRHAARLSRLEFQRAVHDRAFRDVRAEAARILGNFRESPEYPHVLNDLLHSALDRLRPSLAEGERIVVEADPRDHDLLAPELEKSHGAYRFENSGETWGGIVLVTADRRIRVINTIESRLERAEDALRTQARSMTSTIIDRPPDAGA